MLGVERNSFGEGFAYFLDQNTLKIKFPEQRFEHRLLMVLARGVSGLDDRHAHTPAG